MRRIGTVQRCYVEPPGEYRDIDVGLFERAIHVTTVPLLIVQLGWALTGYAIWKTLR